MKLFLFILMTHEVVSLNMKETTLALEYFAYKNVNFVNYFSCGHHDNNLAVVKEFMKHNVRISISSKRYPDLERLLSQWLTPVGILTDGNCENLQQILNMASKLKMFDAMHIWLTFLDSNDNGTAQLISDKYTNLNLSVDADVAVVNNEGAYYSLLDVFNFGKIQGNDLEITPLGAWREDSGLDIWLKGFKYYHRWNFHNLTLRAISVILEQASVFRPEMLSEVGYTPGVPMMTKIPSQQLNLLKDAHNFRHYPVFLFGFDGQFCLDNNLRLSVLRWFNYTIAGIWIGSPERNSTLAVTNALFWEEQDISSTSARMFLNRLPWVDVFFPPMTYLETRFYYLIPDKGVGDYENRFLTPMSPGVWWCTLGAAGICVVVLAGAALRETRNEPGSYAFFSVFAAICQQEYEDGSQISNESQGRRLTLLIVGLTSMLLYNYYTSSVVSWLLNAAAPSIDNLDALISSDLELIFEDIGYARGWLDSPGFFYFSGYVNPKEDILRDKKVTNGKRSMGPLQPVESGLQLVRTGKYAFHTEPYTASHVISRTYEERELCELGSLPMTLPGQTYIYSQKRSPYKQFFVWSLMRLAERGHLKATQARFADTIPPCSGTMPRALALGQAAPAFLLLVEAASLALCIMFCEIQWNRIQVKRIRLKQTWREDKKRSQFNP